MNAHIKVSFDRDYFVCFVPSNPTDALVYTDQDEARQTCRDYPQYVCMRVNPVEHHADMMDDEFADMNVADARLARQLKRHERSFERPL